MSRSNRGFALLPLLLIWSCTTSDSGVAHGTDINSITPVEGAPEVDSGHAPQDASAAERDAQPPSERDAAVSGASDGGSTSPPDAGASDAGAYVALDAGMPPGDAGMPLKDAGMPPRDAGKPLPPDAGMPPPPPPPPSDAGTSHVISPIPGPIECTTLCTTCGACEQLLSYPSAKHITDLTYTDPPPAGGSHNPCWTHYGVHDEAVPDERWVHNLEHGGVVLLYNCPQGCPAELAQLKAMVDAYQSKWIVLTPNAELPKRFAIVAWWRRIVTECLDMPTFRTFYEKNVNHAPESEPDDPPDYCPP